MVSDRQFRLTREGIADLKAELASLSAEHGAIAERIKTAREFGDLAENSEYQAARAEQDHNESRFSEIEHILQNAQLIRAPRSNGKVVLGSKVKLAASGAKAKEFQIVGTIEADPLNGKISDESPIGQVLLGKKEGDEVEIKTLADISTYKVVDIS